MTLPESFYKKTFTRNKKKGGFLTEWTMILVIYIHAHTWYRIVQA
jgi:hypothetical protein